MAKEKDPYPLCKKCSKKCFYRFYGFGNCDFFEEKTKEED